MENFEIWIGRYDMGEGVDSKEPELLATIPSVNFKTACIKYELGTKLQRMMDGEEAGNLNPKDYPWYFNEDTISNVWLGKYYKTKEEAQKSFNIIKPKKNNGK